MTSKHLQDVDLDRGSVEGHSAATSEGRALPAATASHTHKYSVNQPEKTQSSSTCRIPSWQITGNN